MLICYLIAFSRRVASTEGTLRFVFSDARIQKYYTRGICVSLIVPPILYINIQLCILYFIHDGRVYQILSFDESLFDVFYGTIILYIDYFLSRIVYYFE